MNTKIQTLYKINGLTNTQSTIDIEQINNAFNSSNSLINLNIYIR